MYNLLNMAFHQPKNFYLGKKFACHGVILSSQSIVFAQAIEYAYREQRKNQARPCIGETECTCLFLHFCTIN